uniref:Immunoglobulin domain-containing protein n=1 Tax=Junco hyemalis TaxID=40217 RepID=A0A8C5IKT6_JUNHY
MSRIPSGMRPGEGRPTQLHHPQFFLAARAQEPQPLEVTGAVGGVALLNPKTPQNPSEYSQIHWRWKNQLRIATLKRGEKPRYPQSRFEGRLELLENGTLRMSNLNLGDSGEFRLYLEDDTGRESVQRVLLRVYGECGDRGLSQECWGHCDGLGVVSECPEGSPFLTHGHGDTLGPSGHPLLSLKTEWICIKTPQISHVSKHHSHFPTASTQKPKGALPLHFLGSKFCVLLPQILSIS